MQIFDITLEVIMFVFFIYFIAELLFSVLGHIIANLLAFALALVCILELALSNKSVSLFIFRISGTENVGGSLGSAVAVGASHSVPKGFELYCAAKSINHD